MDPLTHFAIGAAIGSVTVGRKVGVRRGALIGAAITMMPHCFSSCAVVVTAVWGTKKSTIMKMPIRNVIAMGISLLTRSLR